LLVAWTVRKGKIRAVTAFPGESLKQEKFSREIPMTSKNKRIVPKFATEAEEADWWYQNRHIHDKQLREAVKSGEAQILTKEKLLARIEASKKKPAPVVALRIPEADLTLARKQAEQKGLPYQTYIKSLFHEALASLALVYDLRMLTTKGLPSRGHEIDALASVPLTRPTAVRRLELRGSSTTRLLNLILVCLGCILILIKVIGGPTQTARPADKDVLSYTDFSYFVEHHNIRAIAVNKKTGDVVGYFRIPANRKFRAEMPPGDSYLYDALRNDGAEVAIQ
jgi:predicted DNA binding CopG/RHH family protein